jgi:hypothetical protein
MEREPTGRHRAPRERHHTPEDDMVEAVVRALPRRSRYAWPLAMLLVGATSSGGGSALISRLAKDDDARTHQTLIGQVEEALQRVNKVESRVRDIEQEARDFKQDIKDDLREIKAAVKDRHNR